MMPYLTKALGADTIEYGKLQTVFSALQCIGGLIAGEYSLLTRHVANPAYDEHTSHCCAYNVTSISPLPRRRPSA